MDALNKFITKRIFNNYANDMGNHFDYIQGHEAEAYQELYAIVENASIYDKWLMFKTKTI